MRRSLFVLVTIGGLMAGLPSQAQPGPQASFRRDVAPVLESSCAMCHQDAAPMGGLSLQRSVARGMLVDMPSTQSPLLRVKPGQPEQSYLVRKLEGGHVAAGGKGLPMPIGQAPLTKTEMDQVRLWITQGAPDN